MIHLYGQPTFLALVMAALCGGLIGKALELKEPHRIWFLAAAGFFAGFSVVLLATAILNAHGPTP